MSATQTTTVAIGGQQFQIPTIAVMRCIVEQEHRAQSERRLELLSGLDSIFNSIKGPAVPALLAKIGDEIQGGIYAGPYFDPEAGRFKHLIAAKGAFAKTDWERSNAAAKEYSAGGFTDWHLPTKVEGHVLQMYLQPLGKLGKGWHWTSAPCGSDSAWALDFELGTVLNWYRGGEFAVLPVRSIIA